jgi:tetratricopeptide (TPR) repeat protein
LRISEEIGNIWGKAYNNFVTGPILIERGRIDQGFQALNNTLDWAKQSNFAAGVVSSQMIMSWVYAMLGDLEKGRQYEPFIRNFVDQYATFRPLYFVNRAQNEMYAGNYDQAAKFFDRVGSDYTNHSELIFHPYIYTLDVEILLRNKQYERALQIAEKYLDTLGHQQVKILVPDLLNQKARAQVGLGQDDRAYETLQEAVGLARYQDSLRILWALLLDLAELEGNRRAAEELQEEARTVIAAILENISDPSLRQKFLNLPQVKRSWNKSFQ